jgi:antitoxin HicB
MNAYAYEVDVRPLAAELGGGFLATVPDLPGGMSDGDTPQEALTGAYDAIGCWIAEALQQGREIPQPAPARNRA